MYYFDAFRQEEHDAAKIMSVPFLVEKFSWEPFHKKTLFWPFFTYIA